ncbi:MAG: hypothetical protein ACKVJX_00065 [Verrucomicrobiia bacterium]|jgi:hypothetical protein
MFSKTLIATALISLVAGISAAQDSPKPAATPKVELNELEKKFQNSMKNAVFVGRWCLTKDGKMGESKKERYTINNAQKVTDKSWVISARMQWGEKDITVPIPISLLWAGDTPVITLDKLWIPGAGTYSARVMVYDDTYAGTWSGPSYGGLLNGVITHPKKKE